MSKNLILFFLLFLQTANLLSQNIRFNDFAESDSVLIDSISKAFNLAAQSINESYEHNRHRFYDEKKLREDCIDLWNSDTLLITWFGKVNEKSEIQFILKRIRKFQKRINKKAVLKMHYKNKGLCKGTRHAWTIPYGKVKIHLCNQFTYKSYRHWVKIFIHEIGHESGILFHRDIYWYSSALRCARDNPWKARRNPENYAYYLMSQID